MLFDYANILIFFVVGILFVLGTMIFQKIISRFVLKTHKPSELKLSPYECGEKPVGPAWIQFNIRFYIIALIFIIFDVEIISSCRAPAAMNGLIVDPVGYWAEIARLKNG